MRVEIEDLVQVVDGKLLKDERADPDVISGVTTDSRQVGDGEVFFALSGEIYDGNDFVDGAVDNGASIVVLTKPVERAGIAVILVEDTLVALGKLAAWWRKEFDLQIVAVVGSSGKTTTKEMAGEILTRFFETLITRGNHNNLIGLPETLFHLNASHQAAVLELGMNVPDENRRLMDIAQPDCVVLTNINHAHIGMFESPRAHYEAEAEPVRYASDDALLIINDDDELSKQAYTEFGEDRKNWRYSIDHPADFYATEIEPARPFGYSFTLRNAKGESAEVTLKIFGRHNVSNAVAAAAIAAYYKVSLEDAAEQLTMFRPRFNRSEIEEIDGYFLVKDYYNAIPAAVISALKSLEDLEVVGRRFAVLGDMMELGEHERLYHEKVAEAAASASLSQLYTVGPRGRIIADRARELSVNVEHFDEMEPLATELKQKLKSGDLLFIKGSRSLRLERLYDLLKSPAAATR